MKDVNKDSKLTSKLVRLGAFGVLASIVTYFGLLYIFGVNNLNSAYYGSYFYAWRLRYADKMLLQRYKFIKPNEHPDTEDRKAFYSLVQDPKGGAYLTRFNRPEHIPRESDFQFSLMFPGYESFLKMRQNYIVETEGLEDKLKLTGEDLVEEVKNRKESERLYFSNYPRKSVDDVMKVMFPEGDGNKWFEVSGILIRVVSNILNEDADYSFDGSSVSSKLMSDIREGLDALDMKDVSDTDINNFFINNGRVSASPVETFAYSRLYYLFYFLTSGIDFEAEHLTKLEESLDDPKKKQEFYEARMMYVANIFARIFSSIYPNGNTKTTANAGWGEKLRGYFSPYTTAEKDLIEEGDIKKIRKEFDEYLETRTD